MNIENMLPFLNKQALDELVDSIIAGEVDFDIRKALPFLDDDALKKLMEYAAENPGKINFDGAQCYPFLSEKIMDEVFLKKLDGGVLDESCLPFVSSECLKKVSQEEEGIAGYLGGDNFCLLLPESGNRISEIQKEMEE